ncbi:tripartite tricarboxylate transporter TctB family protein [Pseudorhodoferax sp. Leaf274]|uniref:tripartite tricarboxylate transporter TctB family protein n=1 Tax=Pseudorhodoferax sp. Leaf274 TaxID=1736318 RepID=UPI0007033459|nr:tripartite tricarboxylate transporter TctB family protein [Pseudorhodoferax sp. Leaf274]KQP47725.1 tripartite tricarboxylate transporter TctB [Pseudorhodoferax sp. Leaf274]
MAASDQRGPQTLVSLGVLLTGLAMGWGALGISSDAGYGGVGPNFLPMLCAAVLTLCGVLLLLEAGRGGFRDTGEDADLPAPYWSGFVWVSAGLLLNAAVIEHLGFILGCTLCYVLAVQGLRRAGGQAIAGSARTWATDLVTGLLISAPVYWMFTKFLAINLPGLTDTGWF